MKSALLAFGMLGAVAVDDARADEIRPGQERFNVVLGAFLPAFNTDVRVDGETDQGDRIDLGGDLGVDQEQTGYLAGLEWRFKEKHRLGITYSNFTLNGSRVIDEEFTIRDTVYPVNATIRTEQSIDIIPITYSYSFINNEENEFAATAGIHWTSASFSLRGTTEDGNFDESSRASADLPLPLFGVRYEHHFSPTWTAGVAGSFFSIEFGESELDAKGSIVNARAFGEYHFAGRYSAGLAIDAFRLSLDMAKTRWQGTYDYSYWGPQLYLSMRF